MSGKIRLLRALRMNALFTLASVLFVLLAADWIAGQLSMSSPMPLYWLAAALSLFALRLFRIVHSRVIHAWEVSGIIAADFGWVLASLVLVAVYHGSMSRIGLVLVDGIALAVLFFAVQQLLGLREWTGTARRSD